MLICYVIAHTLWLEIKTPEEVTVFNVDNVNYIKENTGYPGELFITTNDAHRSIYLENVTIEQFKTCLREAQYKE